MRTLSELMNLRGRVAVVTGGAGRIGSMIGQTLAEMGASVVVVDLEPSRCAEAVVQIAKASDVEAMPMPVNLEIEGEVASVCPAVLKRFGHMEILVNCAALVGSSQLKGWAVPFGEQSLETWRRAHEVNLTAPFHLVQSCADALARSEHGSVINFASIYGMVAPDLGIYEGTSMGNPAAYASSKAGLLQMTRWLSTVLAPRIRVNAITPGGVYAHQPETFVAHYEKRTPLRRMAMTEDLKGAVAYLASDLSAYVTGQNLVVDGGWTAW